jgi:hypothetical protein
MFKYKEVQDAPHIEVSVDLWDEMTLEVMKDKVNVRFCFKSSNCSVILKHVYSLAHNDEITRGMVVQQLCFNGKSAYSMPCGAASEVARTEVKV